MVIILITIFPFKEKLLLIYIGSLMLPLFLLEFQLKKNFLKNYYIVHILPTKIKIFQNNIKYYII